MDSLALANCGLLFMSGVLIGYLAFGSTKPLSHRLSGIFANVGVAIGGPIAYLSHATTSQGWILFGASLVFYLCSLASLALGNLRESATKTD